VESNLAPLEHSFSESNDLEKSPIANLGDDLYFIGWAEYVNASGSNRTLRFCRQFQFETYRFIIVDDPENEPRRQLNPAVTPAGCELAALTFTRTRARPAE
jgi:hypothetical protein